MSGCWTLSCFFFCWCDSWVFLVSSLNMVKSIDCRVWTLSLFQKTPTGSQCIFLSMCCCVCLLTYCCAFLCPISEGILIWTGFLLSLVFALLTSWDIFPPLVFWKRVCGAGGCFFFKRWLNAPSVPIVSSLAEGFSDVHAYFWCCGAECPVEAGWVPLAWGLSFSFVQFQSFSVKFCGRQSPLCL